MKNEQTRTILGFVFSNALAIVVEGGLALFYYYSENLSFVLGSGTFFILPFAMGIICARYWQNQKLRTIDRIGRIILNLLISFLLAVIFLREGVLCLIIVSPLVFAMMYAGFSIGNYIIKKDNNTLKVSIFGLLILLFIVDLKSPHHYENEVSDEIAIDAPPNKVWRYVVAFPEIKAKSHYWFFSIGLPKPIGTSVTGYYKGAVRKCIFERNLVFDEIMSTYEPGKNLTFDVIREPQDPEIMGHINIERGQFLLKDNHNGTTTLWGNSWYSLNVYPALYFDLWAKSITRNVHIRVMEHIKELSEKGS